MGFPCIKCGLCCRHVDKAVEATRNIEGLGEFPYEWDETGRCEMLDENDRCKVYNNRPLICNIDRMVKEFDLGETTFYNENIKSCNLLLEQENRIERIDLIT